jgi:hypothetical protein
MGAAAEVTAAGTTTAVTGADGADGLLVSPTRDGGSDARPLSYLTTDDGLEPTRLSTSGADAGAGAGVGAVVAAAVGAPGTELLPSTPSAPAAAPTITG